MMGAPGRALRVNMAAKSGVGRSSVMSVSVILAGLGASRGMNSKRAGSDAESSGELGLAGKQVRCAAELEKVRAVLATWEKWAGVGAE